MDAHTWDERYALRRQWSVTPNEFVASAVSALPTGRALDLACGEGRNAIWLAAQGWQVTAIDFSAAGIERASVAAREAGVEVDWVVGDVLEHDLPQTDLALISYLQLAPEPRRTALRRAWEVLVPGGTFFLIAHDSTNLTEGTGGPQDSSVLYTAGDVLTDLGLDDAAAGARVVHSRRVARRVPADDAHGGDAGAVAWDALVQLVRAS